MLRIENHRPIGDGVTFRATPHHGGTLKPRYLVFHYTAGRSAEISIESLCTRNPQGNVSAHLVLARDSRIVQLAPFNVVTWHAGVSQWNGLVGLNQRSARRIDVPHAAAACTMTRQRGAVRTASHVALNKKRKKPTSARERAPRRGRR